MNDPVKEMSNQLIASSKRMVEASPNPTWVIKTTDAMAYLYRDGIPSLWMDLKTFEQLVKPTK